jgi:hypothetical protein
MASPNFETYSRDLPPLKRYPWVTVQKRGVISLNHAAYTSLGEPSAVHLLYDPQEQILGLRPADWSADGAHAVRSQTGKPAGPFVISAIAFMNHYAIERLSSYRWTAYTDDDETLCINLNSPRIPVTSNRAKCNTSATLNSADERGDIES